jgi:hypothetical protein
MPWNGTAIDSEILAVHAALVPSGDQGEVVLFGGDEHWVAQEESAGGDRFKKTRVYDVKTHTVVTATIPSPDSDVFCSHHAFAADGRLLIGGGTSKWPESGDAHVHALDFLGHRRCWVYSPHRRAWSEVSRFNKNPDQPDEENSGGRWYPGLVTLGNGDVFAAFGHPMQQDFRHRSSLPERFNLAANSWSFAPKEMAYPIEPSGGVRFLFFPRMFVLRDGNLFIATPMPVDYETAASGDGPYFSTRYDPATGDYVGHKIPEPGFGGYLDWSRPAVLLPLLPEEDYRPRVLFCGETGALRIDLGDANGEWQATGPRDASVSGLTRKYSNAAILPTGQVCLVGGVNVVDPEAPVSKAELYEPGIDWATGAYANPDGWAVDPAVAAFTRNYHSVCLLLPNGKVWVAGGDINAQSGDPNVVGIKKIELYEPAYITVPNRLQINAAPKFAAYGQSFDIMLDRPASNVSRVALIRAGSATHSTNNDQRYVGLAISARSGNTLTVSAPPSGNVAPPGYYMLWVVDNVGNPCQLATFVRLAYVGCTVTTDRSTFSEEEIASIGGGGQATISNAVYVYYDGFLDGELAGTPSVALAWADTNAAIPASALSLIAGPRLLETSPPDPDVAHRITYPFAIRFADTSLWAGIVDRRQIRMTFSLGPFTCTETIDLSKSPNPYMIDIDPAINNAGWLSTDVRVFVTASGTSKFSVAQGNGAGAARTFLRGVVDAFNAAPNGPSHPFLSIPQAQDSEPLVLATGVFGIQFYNYAIAKVRYRATTTTAQRVKTFFRLFNTVGTALAYDPAGTYHHTGPGPGTVPLLGVAGGEVVSIPFFLGERVETVAGRTGATSMTSQTLDSTYEIRDITPVAGAEVVMYFGCWLDINQTRKLFPITPGGSEGPWPESATRSIQELVRGRHQCLVAEVYFEPDATDPGETPGSSDNLSQRNLTILFSDNPGPADSHLAVHTFELKPSTIPALPKGVALEAVPLGGAPVFAAAMLEHSRQYTPDELLFHWHNLPADAEVTVYFSDVDTEEIARLSGLRLSPPPFEVIDNRTLRFQVGNVAWIPLPGGRQTHIPALISIRLPDSVHYGQTYRLSIHQVDGTTRQIIGAFEISIPIAQPDIILDEEVRTLSVLRHVATTIPLGNRWYPIFLRYLGLLAGKVDALGGDSSTVFGNPDGSGRPYVPEPAAASPRSCVEGWLVAVLAAVGLVLAGTLPEVPTIAVAVTISIVLLVAVAAWWSRRCCGSIRCALLDYLLLGASSGASVLAVLLAFGFTAPGLVGALTVGAVVTALSVAASFGWRCRGRCCDARDDCAEAVPIASTTIPPRARLSGLPAPRNVTKAETQVDLVAQPDVEPARGA